MGSRLAGSTALISGAARGIGATAARPFVEAGANVVLGDVLDREGRSVADDLNGTRARSARSTSTST